jgi:hypothetical protein
MSDRGSVQVASYPKACALFHHRAIR